MQRVVSTSIAFGRPGAATAAAAAVRGTATARPWRPDGPTLKKVRRRASWSIPHRASGAAARRATRLTATAASATIESGRVRIISEPPFGRVVGTLPGEARAVLAAARVEAREQFLEDRALLEVAETRVGGGDAIQRQHLLHRVGVAEEHHDFFQVRTAHVSLLPGRRHSAQGRRATRRLHGNGAPRRSRLRAISERGCGRAQRATRADRARAAEVLRNSTARSCGLRRRAPHRRGARIR